MVFPALFTAGMTLLDTTDSVLMVGAYGWAFAKPIRKLYYNMTITLVSVVVAVLVGGVEALGLVADRLKLEGGFWDGVGALNDNFGVLGLVIVGLFLVELGRVGRGLPLQALRRGRGGLNHSHHLGDGAAVAGCRIAGGAVRLPAPAVIA